MLKRLKTNLVICASALLLIGVAAPAAAQAGVQNFGYLKCQSPGAVGTGMPIVYLNWNNLSNNYAKPTLYRYEGGTWVQRGTGVQTIQYGWGPWYRTDTGAKLAGWVWGNQAAGWYAINMRVRSHYTSSGAWGPYEYGWTDTNPYDLVGQTYCWVGSRSAMKRAPQPESLPAAR